MKWWWKSIIHFFNFYPSEKRGVLILMGTLFAFLLFKKHLISQWTKPSEISVLDKIELYHPSYYMDAPCVSFKDSLKSSDFYHWDLDPALVQKVILNNIKNGRYNCVSDLLDVAGVTQQNIDCFYALSPPDFFNCPLLNINQSSALEVSNFFRININKGKTLVNYRNSIGGFVKFEQINQVYGFPKSKLQAHWACRIELGSQSIQRVDLRTVTYRELVKHGFINRKAARNLIHYRKKRRLRLADVRNEVSQVNKPLVAYYFKE